MSHWRDNRSTQLERSESEDFDGSEARSGHFKVEKRDTLWQARLVLSTLDPRGPTAGRLRTAIRNGNTSLVQVLRDAIYEERSEGSVVSEPPNASASVRPVTRSTMLPPASVAPDRKTS